MSDEGYHWVKCFVCKTSFALPSALHTSAKCSQKILFYCPYGHELCFPPDLEEVKHIEIIKEEVQPESESKSNIISIIGHALTNRKKQ